MADGHAANREGEIQAHYRTNPVGATTVRLLSASDVTREHLEHVPAQERREGHPPRQTIAPVYR